MLMCTLFEGRGDLKKYVLYTHGNIFGWHLNNHVWDFKHNNATPANTNPRSKCGVRWWCGLHERSLFSHQNNVDWVHRSSFIDAYINLQDVHSIAQAAHLMELILNA